MALDQSFVGRSYPPRTRYHVEREKIREFAEALGDANPAYVDREAAQALGHEDVIAPPTFVFTFTFAAADVVVDDPQLGIDYSRVVHGEQKFTYSRPLRAGDLLGVTSTIEGIRPSAGGETLTLRGDVHDEAGDHVVTARMKILVRSAEAGEA